MKAHLVLLTLGTCMLTTVQSGLLEEMLRRRAENGNENNGLAQLEQLFSKDYEEFTKAHVLLTIDCFRCNQAKNCDVELDAMCKLNGAFRAAVVAWYNKKVKASGGTLSLAPAPTPAPTSRPRLDLIEDGEDQDNIEDRMVI